MTVISLMLAAAMQFAEPEMPVEIEPIQEVTSAEDTDPRYAMLYRNFNRNFAAPFYRSVFLSDSAEMPEGGRKAAEFVARYKFGDPIYLYWSDDLLSDLKPDCENVFYRALILRLGYQGRKGSGLDERKLLEDAYNFYCRRRSEVNPLLAAEFASAYLWTCGEQNVHRQEMQMKLMEDIERAVCDRSICNPETVEFVACLVRMWDLGESEELLERLEKRAAEIDGWFMEDLRGAVKYRQAWNARGKGYAKSVTRDGWKGYGALIREAEAHRRKAFELRPDIFASASGLCQLEQPDASQEEQDAWFKAGLATRLDAIGLRRIRLFHFTSRWGGSIQDMTRELEAMAPFDGDFHTRIPALNVMLRWQSISKYEYDDDDADTREDFFRYPKETRDKTLAIIREYLKPGSSLWLEDPDFRDEMLRDFTVAAYACGDYQLMVECWRRITPGIWANCFASRTGEKKFALTKQTMWHRLPFMLELARYPKHFARFSDAFNRLYSGDETEAVAELVKLGSVEAPTSALRKQIAEDVYRIMYRWVCEDRTEVSLMDNLLVHGNTVPRYWMRLPKTVYPERTAFRECQEAAWYCLDGIKRDFEGSTEFVAKRLGESGTGKLDFWLGEPQLLHDQSTPAVGLEYRGGDSGEWTVRIWEKTGKWDNTWSRYNDIVPAEIVKPVKIKDVNGEVRVRVDFADGQLMVMANGRQITPRPLVFAVDGKNRWYKFNFLQQAIKVADHRLYAQDEVREEYEVPMVEVPPFESQDAILPLPTLEYATNETVAAAAEIDQPVFPDYVAPGITWWGIKFNSSEQIEQRPEIVQHLESCLDNRIWWQIPKSWRGKLALRFAALALQAGEPGMAAEYLQRYVPESLLESPLCLAVPDIRYDNSNNPGSHGMKLQDRLWNECTKGCAAWRMVRHPGSAVSINHAFSFQRNGFKLPADDDWQVSVCVSGAGGYRPNVGCPDIDRIPAFRTRTKGDKLVAYLVTLDYKSNEISRQSELECDCGPQGDVTFRLMNRDGKLTYFIDDRQVFVCDTPKDGVRLGIVENPSRLRNAMLKHLSPDSTR